MREQIEAVIRKHLMGDPKVKDALVDDLLGLMQRQTIPAGTPVFALSADAAKRLDSLERQLGRLDSVDHRCDMLKERMDRWEVHHAPPTHQLGAVENRMDTLDIRITEARETLDRVTLKLGPLESVQAAHTEQIDSLTDHVDSLDATVETIGAKVAAGAR